MEQSKNIEIFKNLKWFNNIIGVNIDVNVGTTSTDESVKKAPIFLFGTFERPNDIVKNCLNIMVDHSFEYNENDNVIFIDHHLVEQCFNVNYKSNANLMYSNYQLIYDAIKAILDSYSFNSICIRFHEDLDGIMSAIVMKKIMVDIVNGKADESYSTKLKLANILGNYGDIAPDAMVDLIDLLSTNDNVKIYDKKIGLFCKTLSRYMKATRSIRNSNDSLLNDIYSAYIDETCLDIYDIKSIERLIYKSIQDMDDVNLKVILTFMNKIAQNKIIYTLVKFYNQEIERIVNTFVNPDKNQSASFEMIVKFKNDELSTPFRLLIIDTPFDMGRSIIWKYRSSYNAVSKTSASISEWYYKATDWAKLKPNTVNLNNIACYNIAVNKLSLDGITASAYKIAEALGGGGHANTGDGRSLGSVKVDNIDTVLSECVVLDIF